MNELKPEPLLAVTYLGKSTPRYARSNLRTINKLFPELQKIFICETESTAKWVSKFNWLPIIVDANDKLKDLRELIGLDQKFRYDYWFKVMARLFVLDEIYKKIGDKPFLQIEADVRLSPSFPFHDVFQIKESLAFPLYDKTRGAASILYIRDKNSFEIFKKFFYKSLENNSTTNDMEILFNFWQENRQKVKILPTLPLCGHQDNLSVPEEVRITSRHDESQFSGIFDALSYGLFYFGWDPRNNKGWRLLFSPEESQLTSFNQVHLRSKRRRIYLVCRVCSLETELFNLHIHSKDPILFSEKVFKFIVQIRSMRANSGPTKEISSRYFLRRIKFVRDSIRGTIRKLKDLGSKTYGR
jgi:hypothetical protein